MFRNIQRKQRLIDEQFNRAAGAQGDENGGIAQTDTRSKERASLLHSANKLLTTEFIDSVLNQKDCTDARIDEEDLINRNYEAKDQRYVESARRLNKA